MYKPSPYYSQLPYLRKIEDQISVVQKMINEDRYNIDILTQLHAVLKTIRWVKDNICTKYIEKCPLHAIDYNSENERNNLINEVIDIFHKFQHY